MGGSSFVNPMDDSFYHPQALNYHPSMGGSLGTNVPEPYVPDFFHSQSHMYQNFGANIDYQGLTDFMAVTSISSPTFSPHIGIYSFTTLPPMALVIDDDDDDDDAPPKTATRSTTTTSLPFDRISTWSKIT